MKDHLHTTRIDTEKEEVRIYSRDHGRWVWYTYEDFLREGIAQWKKAPVCRLSEVRKCS
jgi:hypothetical protein